MRNVRIIAPVSSRGGRRFEPVDELALHDLIDALASSLPGPRGDVLVVPEMPSPLGLPDFVAVVGGTEWLARRSAAGIGPVLSDIDCAVLAATSPARPLRIDTLSRRLGWSKRELEPAVGRLVRSGALTLSSGGAVTVHPALKPIGTVFAVEAKIKDWRRAVLQGRTYRTWANNYIVVLGDVGPTAVDRAREGVAEDAAGLFTRAGWVVRPAVRDPAATRRLQGFEHLFAAIGSQPSF
ncbi:hypothetical protein [Nocardioides caricicola]|uniref:Uncharacterized protein n=1 Tax=Nocardioides caricicola TaxID=634770 RepID=A0ABW0N417_9ACTN